MLTRSPPPPTSVPELVDEAGARRGEDRPGERADQRRHVIGQLHQPLELGAAGQLGAGQGPGGEKADHDRHHRRQAGDKGGVGEDVPVVDQIAVIADAVFGRRKDIGFADVQRFGDQVDERIGDQPAAEQQDRRSDDRLAGRQPTRAHHPAQHRSIPDNVRHASAPARPASSEGLHRHCRRAPPASSASLPAPGRPASGAVQAATAPLVRHRRCL